jgi:TPR repeat protein
MRTRLLTGLVLTALAVSAGAGFAEEDPPASADVVAGIKAYNAGDFATARTRLQAAANRGEAEAMANLGYLYARGQGVRANSDYARTLYERAAALGDGEGMNAIGYRYNFASKPDFPLAITWYCRAIARSNPRAMNNLANMAHNGVFIPRDSHEARQLWRQAMTHGNLGAEANLGVDLLSDPTSSAAERQQGLALLRDAAMQGGAFAQEVLQHYGVRGQFPPPTVTSGTMLLEPRHSPPGTSAVCEQVVS